MLIGGFSAQPHMNYYHGVLSYRTFKDNSSFCCSLWQRLVTPVMGLKEWFSSLVFCLSAMDNTCSSLSATPADILMASIVNYVFPKLIVLQTTFPLKKDKKLKHLTNWIHLPHYTHGKRKNERFVQGNKTETQKCQMCDILATLPTLFNTKKAGQLKNPLHKIFEWNQILSKDYTLCNQ